MKKTRSGPLLSRIFGDRARREAEIVETRLAVSLLVLLLTRVLRVWTVPPSVPWIVAGYMCLTVLTVLAFRRQLDRKRIRLLPELLDVLTISLLVHATGGLASTWFVLYLFPVLSSARFLGPGGILAFAAASAVAYALATTILGAGTSLSLAAFALRALALGGVSLTAANLARTRDSAEAKLIAAENLIYASPDPIIVVDHEGKVRNFNHACEELWGRKETEVRGSYVGQFYESEERVREVGRRLRSAPDHILRNHPTMLRGADGSPIPIRLSAASFFDESGNTKGSIGIFRDQREILRLEEEKLRSEKLAALGRLAQTSGHDIKHDLGTIFSFLAPLERSARSEPVTLRALKSIRAAATQARDKLQNMLSVGRLQPPQKQVTSLKAALEMFEQSVSLRAEAARVQLVVHLPETDPQIYADAEQLRQVLANLFGNSLDAIKWARAAAPGRKASVIEVTLEADVENIHLTWRDDGCGMSQEALQRTFTALYTTKETGSGLGLYITRAIVESHQGSISVESEEGGGTTFRIDLPTVDSRVVERPLSG